MLTNIPKDFLPVLNQMQIPFTVIKGTKDITDFVEVDLNVPDCRSTLTVVVNNLDKVLKFIK